jgi:hypothetical protein
MESFLCDYRFANKDVKKSYENAILHHKLFCLKKIWIPKSNFHLSWTTTSFTFVFKMPIGQTWAMVQAITNTMCFKPNKRVLVIIKHICFYIHLVHCYESWCGQHRGFESIIGLW